MNARKIFLAVALLPLLITGCSSGHSASTSQSVAESAPPGQPGRVPAGPGPADTYTVAAQPAPGTCQYRKTTDGQPLPDPACTPGATNPRVTAQTYKDTICKTGYTQTIRPPSNITTPEKKANAASYGYTGDLRDAEYDHLLSLELGGDPNDPRNLWVEPPSPGHTPGAGPNNPKDSVENKLHVLICSGKVALTDAQNAIASDWTTALTVLGHPNGN
ncbi:hypothetical protein [Nocardia stercoris]|uniref:DUF3558 domain-containing protein n=1 Tax=Nocardia stercoris TaxID=2483361 RepID=A0A3M2L470_9NOCA|nr:hypothetical protein [Nocardia stercoris]RMI32174.1 hypothetical protein EBN03_14295 [Nocardia stercoris]